VYISPPLLPLLPLLPLVTSTYRIGARAAPPPRTFNLRLRVWTRLLQRSATHRSSISPMKFHSTTPYHYLGAEHCDIPHAFYPHTARLLLPYVGGTIAAHDARIARIRSVRGAPANALAYSGRIKDRRNACVPVYYVSARVGITGGRSSTKQTPRWLAAPSVSTLVLRSRDVA